MDLPRPIVEVVRVLLAAGSDNGIRTREFEVDDEILAEGLKTLGLPPPRTCMGATSLEPELSVPNSFKKFSSS